MRFVSGLILSILIFAGCSKVHDPVELPNGGSSIRIHIKIPQKTEANAAQYSVDLHGAGDPSGNESAINTLVFYFFDNAGQKVYERQFLSKDLIENQPDWVSSGIVNFPVSDANTLSKAYSVYVLANHIPIGVTDKASLLQEIVADLPKVNTDNFIVEGHIESESAFDVAVVPMVSVQLRRLTAKVMVHLTLAPPGFGELYDVKSWSDQTSYALRNCVTNSYLIERAMPTLGDLEHTSENGQTFYPDGYLPVSIVNSGGELIPGVTYTYEHNWKNDQENSTYLILQVPYKTKTGRLEKNNYYKVKLSDDKLMRNYLYDTYVTVSMKGSQFGDNPAEITTSRVDVIDWINVNIGTDIVNDYLYVPGTRFSMYGDKVSFRYKASRKPNVYLTTAQDEWDDNQILPANEAWVDVSGYSMGEGIIDIYRNLNERFAKEVPRKFYAFFHVRSIVKSVIIDQYPYSYFGTTSEGAKDLYHIITPKDTEEYPIGYTLVYNEREDAYTTAIHELANKKVSPDFRIQSEPVVVDGDANLDAEFTYPKEAEDYCLRLQKASGDRWTLPTIREWQLVAEACRTVESQGGVSPVPDGYYFVGQRSTYYSGYVVEIPSGHLKSVYYSSGNYKVRCVRNTEN